MYFCKHFLNIINIDFIRVIVTRTKFIPTGSHSRISSSKLDKGSSRQHNFKIKILATVRYRTTMNSSSYVFIYRCLRQRYGPYSCWNFEWGTSGVRFPRPRKKKRWPLKRGGTIYDQQPRVKIITMPLEWTVYKMFL